ncbi:MAG: hypothetical protein DRN99_08765 [Thermoproteota archaeon]|nr:MAG: hypothetical protein DRN99_08765 [Candidatus Korarchaeota archaeon]
MEWPSGVSEVLKELGSGRNVVVWGSGCVGRLRGSFGAVDSIVRGGPIEVEGIVLCRGDCLFKDSVRARSFTSHGGVEVDGDLEVEGEIKAEGWLAASGAIRAKAIMAGGSLTASELRAEVIKAEGRVKAEAIEASRVEVGSFMVCKLLKAGEVKVKTSMEAGLAEAESVEVGVIVISCDRLKASHLKVGSSGASIGRLEADEAEVEGGLHVEEAYVTRIAAGRLSAGFLKARVAEVKGEASARVAEVSERLAVGHSLEAEELKASAVEVSGRASISKCTVHKLMARSLEADYLKASILDVSGEVSLRSGDVGRLSAGSLTALDSLKAGEVDVRGDLIAYAAAIEASSLDVGGRLEAHKLKATVARVEGDVEVSSIIEAKALSTGGVVEAEEVAAGSLKARGLDAEYTRADLVKVADGGKARGTIVAREVKLGDGARCEAVYSRVLEAGARCILTEVHASSVKLGSYTVVLGDLEYTESLELGEGVKLAKPPRRVDEVKPPKRHPNPQAR